LDAIRACRDSLGTDVPMVAVFDTAFHQTLPPRAAEYAIPRDLTSRLGIRRFGFHGIAHQQMAQRCAALLDKPLDGLWAVTLQLGNGCSATAVRGGQSIDTSMGLTPLEGLMMGTRSGNVDSSLVGHLMRRGGMSLGEVERCLNTQSGLLGVSGLSSDMRTLLEAERHGHERASLAIEMYCHRVRQYVGAYLAIMGGADAIVFGGGIGENSPQIRERICANMSWCGLTFDPERNSRAVGREGRINADGSTMHAFVVTVNEEQVILQETMRVLSTPPRE
jgi:acetate kinase